MEQQTAEPSPTDGGIFAGLRVIEAATFIAGPAAATIMSDFGADVIKVEQPGLGDPWRHQYTRPELPACDDNYFWILTARNKRSIALDLKRPEGQAILHRMVRAADVFLTNMPLAVRDKLGIEATRLMTLNPRLIYASFTGYGEVGSEKDEAGFDTTAWWARSGLMHLVRPDPDGPPARSMAGMGDHTAALALFGAIVAALYDRERTGQGAVVGSSLLANGAWSNGCYIQAALSGATFPTPWTRDKNPNPLNNHYRCRDGRWFSITMNAMQQQTKWPRFVDTIGRPGLATDPDFSTFDARRRNAHALTRLLDDAFAARDAAEWQALMRGTGFVTSVVATPSDASHDEQMRDTRVTVPMDGTGGSGMTVNSPLWIEGRDKTRPAPPPALGQHTDAVLAEFDLAPDQISALRRDGVVA